MEHYSEQISVDQLASLYLTVFQKYKRREDISL